MPHKVQDTPLPLLPSRIRCDVLYHWFTQRCYGNSGDVIPAVAFGRVISCRVTRVHQNWSSIKNRFYVTYTTRSQLTSITYDLVMTAVILLFLLLHITLLIIFNNLTIFEPKVVTISARNTIMRKFANFVRLYFPHITTFFNQILEFYYF